MAEAKKSSRLIDYGIAFALVFIIAQLVIGHFFPGQKPNEPPITLQAPSSVRLGAATATITVKKNTTQTLTIPSRCPQPPFDVFTVMKNGEQNAPTPMSATGTAIPCDQIAAMKPIEAGKSEKIDLNPWKYSLFSKTGTYEVRLPQELASGTGVVAAHFDVIEPNAFVKLFRAVITKPFLNFLILTASILPSHSLGIAIILLTLLVKLLLFIPTQHALEGQKKMQLLQPKLEAVKKQYKDNPTKMQEETMRLWKEHGVNPLQSCLPILVQFPVLIGLLYVIRDSSNIALSHELIYPVYQNLSWNFNTHFLGLDLTVPNLYIFPILLVILQFIQMKLSFMIADRKKAQQIEKAEAKTGMEMQQNIMLYALPLMIGFFALSFPAAVALYWGISTIFAIGQQVIVNREHIKA
jgi:YidC/Oxa1 family membrane protein insertase